VCDAVVPTIFGLVFCVEPGRELEMDARLYLLVMASSRCVKVEAISVMAEAKRESDESFSCTCCPAEGQRSDNTRSAEERDGVKDVQVRERNNVDRHLLAGGLAKGRFHTSRQSQTNPL
jgi:hypothetical protein